MDHPLVSATSENFVALALRTEAPPTTARTNLQYPQFQDFLDRVAAISKEANELKRWAFYGKAGTVYNTSATEAQTIPPVTDAHLRLVHGYVGLISELHELLTAFEEDDARNIGEELGDIFWYMALLVDAANHEYPALQAEPLTFDKIMTGVIRKLQARYPDKFTPEAALHRDLLKEAAALDQGFANAQEFGTGELK